MPVGGFQVSEHLRDEHVIEAGDALHVDQQFVFDHEVQAILEAVAEAGALGAGYVVIRLPLGVGPIFERWLEEHFPGSKTKILERIRDMRGGKLNDSRFGSRMRGEGIHAEMIRQMFSTAARKAGLDQPRPSLSTAAFNRPGEQLTLF